MSVGLYPDPLDGLAVPRVGSEELYDENALSLPTPIAVTRAAMSLSVHDPRSRGKSPGRSSRDRSRSRDTRAPSPPHRSTRERTKKSTKEYYDSETDSEPRRKTSSKKYKDETDSDDNHRHKKSSRRHRDASDSDTYKKHAKKRHSDDDSDDKSKKSSRKFKDRGRDRSESSSSSSSSSDDDHRSSRHKESKPKHKTAEPNHRRGSSPDSHALTMTKRGEYVQSAKPQYDRERADGRHPSYAGPNPYEHARPEDYSRHLSTSGAEPPYAVPGQYNWDYDHSNEAPSTSRHPSISQEQQRQLSMSAGVNANIGYAQHPQYAPQQVPPQYGYAQPQHQQQRPEAHRIHSTSSTGSAHFQYAEPSQDFNYLPKADGRKPSYSMSARPQFADTKPHSSALHAEPPSGLGSKMHRLSVSGGAGGMLALAAPGQHHSHDMHGGLPPGSPLLEAYHGTYQSISPMPSPLMLPSTMDEGLSDLEPLSPGYSSDESRSKSSHHGRKANHTIVSKRVSFYDPEPDALALAAALKHSTPDPAPINEILPQLSEDHILELRTEYKKHIKVGGKGINIAKHIKLKVPGNLGKAAYAVALGRWESEAHWANFWYQSNSSRRELLIESLMGRTNSEIVKIKDAFSDKRYDDSLEKCMQTELKKDKFRNAVLLALEEKRMSNNEKLDVNLVRRDTQELHRALTSKEGGETAMINIIVVRSDNHLREVLRSFEASYRKNFAREMIQKSRNLVGETLAHILNGVLNRPVRDALLLHQAINETSKDRAELLVSRLVRFHWEPKHLEKVKQEYRRKYGHKLEHVIKESTKGDFGEFCLGLCGGGVR
ncbi:MAG: hypothetical protein L6R42_001163 [Xanthoria sp. 1 TBL-2021]|nr:MAG: hypothetical protein L6R42_001163 [Xanthoria sp. 1 TBL-2021]